jgi:hypothetical protein
MMSGKVFGFGLTDVPFMPMTFAKGEPAVGAANFPEADFWPQDNFPVARRLGTLMSRCRGVTQRWKPETSMDNSSLRYHWSLSDFSRPKIQRRILWESPLDATSLARSPERRLS